jgi:NADPH:quinone reductase-like Zn-dependent oxidoreductase
LTQLAANAGVTVIAVAHADATQRLRGYGAAEVIDHATASLVDKLRGSHPAGVDVLIDLARTMHSSARWLNAAPPGPPT